MLHFLYTHDQLEPWHDRIYELANLEIVKHARRCLGSNVPVRLALCTGGRVTDSADDILLGHPTYQRDLSEATAPNWVTANTLENGADAHPNTYVLMPWSCPFPATHTRSMPFLEQQLLAARRIFCFCGEIWFDQTQMLSDGSLQARVKDKLIRINVGCHAALLPFTHAYDRNRRGNLLHISSFIPCKEDDLLFDSVEGIDATLYLASFALRGKEGRLSGFNGRPLKSPVVSIGAIHNGDPRVNEKILSGCAFYIHTSSQDAQATTILENCARGLVPIVTPTSGFKSPYAFELTADARRNREIIAAALEMTDDEYEYRSRGVRRQILALHGWDRIYGRVWQGIQADQNGQLVDARGADDWSELGV